MTPKEKAKELVDKFYVCELGMYFTWEVAKKCALIAVELKLDSYFPFVTIEMGYENSREYWEEVKTEIENL